ncbi:NIPSNAP family protein [Mucilaginibacter boryungensis]|uniref:NIPSNAP family protein n=1 Tax=Mucilaginibacter boryungensis TaxID=768480 RepID=A0ABR9XIH6_9SPHI|nr:NIPSNAP family protein [Mucilaginibacter boryungensis]MBE9667182.1 NIPSNAP family protein [Mucilaginibacter boryungensis]
MLKLNSIKALPVLALLLLFQLTVFAKPTPYYYQLKVYHLKGKTQQDMVDNYLQNAYIPALHRGGIPAVGVFKPLVADTAEQLVYVFIPFKKIDAFLELDATLTKDQQYQEAGKDYLNAVYNHAPYLRMENILMKAFRAVPEYHIPKLTAPKSERVYELRSYESATENIALNKMNMFNDAEISIFTNLNFNAVFYGQVIAGSHMPNLMYLTTFENKADRDKHWANFGPEYKKISTLPKYLNNVSKNVTLFVRPTDYSDI